MKILSIESSCDETAAAVVEKKKAEHLVCVLSDIKATSAEMHAKTGGIVPEVAAREQIESILPVIQEALKTSGLRTQNIDALGVTIGPGLIGSLLIGVETARSLAYAWNKPLIPVNHLLAHLYGNWIKQSPSDNQETASYIKQGKTNHQIIPEFPALGLVISGGHSDLVLMENHQAIEYIGGTRDDAAGECLDKCARIVLGAAYPGGPAIEKAARRFLKRRFKQKEIDLKIRLPRPMIKSDDLDMSFSGLKTAVVNLVKELKYNKINQNLTTSEKGLLSYEIQEAISDVLISKATQAIERFKVKCLLVGGGVAANQRLREKVNYLGEKSKIEIFVPPLKWCTDNAATIGARAIYQAKAASINLIKADPSLLINK